jgi:hypothetical protein
MSLFKSSRSLLLLGMAALVAANLAMHFLRPGPSFSGDAKDGLSGFLYGVAIAAMLLGIRRRGCDPGAPLA